MKQIRLWLTTMVALLCILTASAHDFEVDGIYYNITSSTDLTVSVTYRGSSYGSYSNEYTGVVTLPSTVTYNGAQYSVTSIGKNAFYKCSSLTSITLPEGVTSIGDYAFYNCSSLTSITLPESVTSIGDYAFVGCNNLSSITLPEGVTSIGRSAFTGTAWYSNQPDGVIYAGKVLYDYKGTMPTNTSIEVRDGTVSIGSSAFYNCSSLTSITLPESVTSIGAEAFLGCSSLTSITIPENVTSIGDWAFQYCSSLTSFTIPENVTSLGGSVFRGCTGELIVNCNIISSPSASPFYGSKFSKVTIGNKVTKIGDGAFSWCDSIASIIISESVTSIGYWAFGYCRSLTSITIPESVTSIGDYAFDGCDNLSSITLPESVTSIGMKAFQGCTGELVVNCNIPSVSSSSYSPFYESEFSKVVVGDKVTSIGDYAFVGCNNLSSITLPESVTSIGMNAFSNCTGELVVNCNIPSVSSSSSSPFNYSKFSKVSFGNKVSSIGEYAFYRCDILTSITIPESVTSIGMNAFQYCTGELVVNCNIPSVSSSSSSPFNYSKFSKVIIGDKVTSIGDYAFSGSGLTVIIIPESLKSIGKSSFLYCTKLCKVINYSNLELSIGSSDYGLIAYYADQLIDGKELTTIGDFQFYTSCGTHFLTNYIGHDRDVVLPEDYNGEGYKIDEYGFCSCSSSTFFIPENVTSIGQYAFYNCSNLTTIDIPEGVTSIGDYAFSGCESLTSITIPESIVSIGGSVFYRCRGELIVNCVIPSVSSSSSSPFYESEFSKVTIGDKVTSIGDYAFRGCSSIESVTIPESVTSIGNYAFSGCSRLAAITIPANVTNIGDYALSGCSSLASTTIPESVTSIGKYAFSNCTGELFVNCNIPSVSYYEDSPFYKSKFNKVVVGNEVTSIGDYAFYNCSSLTAIAISESVTIIGNWAFDNCTSLKSVVIKDGCESLSIGYNGTGQGLFYECPLEEVYLGRNLSYSSEQLYGFSPFYKKNVLTKVVVGNNVTDISQNAFYGCDGLKDIILGDNIGSLGDKAFYGCASLQELEFPDSLESIGSYCFNGCTSLQNVTIGNGVKSIGSCAFSGCSSLDGFSFGNNVETIGAEAFSGCTSLTSITSHAAVPPVCGAQALDDIDKRSCTLRVPIGYAAAYQAADQWEEFLFVEDVVEIAKYALIYMVDGEVYHVDSLAFKEYLNVVKVPEREGHTFSGWSEIPETMPAEDVTISGYFTVNKYLVTFVIDGEVIASDSLEYGSAIVAPEAPEKEGYTFNGWGEVVETVPAEDVTFYGSYSVNSYLLTYVVDGATVQSDSVAYGSTIVALEEPTKEGHTFSGWGEVPETMPAEDVTISGFFTVNIYKVYYYVGDELVHTAEVAYGEAIPEYVYEPTAEGDVFVGWVGETYETMPAHDVTYTANIESGIEEIENSKLGIESSVIYDLHGRKIQVDDLRELERGVYIIDNKKVVIK